MKEKTDWLCTVPTYTVLEKELSSMRQRYPELRISTLAYSVCGRRIPYLLIGKGKQTVLYVAAHHSMEWITSNMLLAFAEELLQSCLAEENKSTARLLEQFRFVIVPQLNPDGVSLVLEGADKEHVLYHRQLRMNGNSGDFSHWQANARGVDLNHNYSVGFYEYREIQASLGILSGGPTLYAGTYPESEPETAALAGLVRILRPGLILTLHTQGEEIYYDSPHATPSMHKMAQALASLTGYTPSVAEGTAAYGGLTEWAVRCGIPSFTMECGKGTNPLPLSEGESIYCRLKDAFFFAPQLSLL